MKRPSLTTQANSHQKERDKTRQKKITSTNPKEEENMISGDITLLK